MRAFWKGRLFRFGLGVIFLVTLLLFGLLSWLTSGIGKGLVEARLSAALARPVRLEGDFSIAIFPLPGAAGADLLIFSRDGQLHLLTAGEYKARLELWPLLKGEVQVVALHVADARMDIGALAGEEPSVEPSGRPLSGLPSIQNFQLGNTRVHTDGMDSEPYLQINDFELEDFRPGDTATFRIDAALISDGARLLGIKSDGQLVLTAESVLDIQLSDLDVSYGNWLIEKMDGEVSANLVASDMFLRLQWTDGEQRFALSTRLDQDPGYPDGRPGLEIESLEISLGEHAISGQGCLLLLEPPALHLHLKASSVDLDDIAMLADQWTVPAAVPTSPSDTTDELPIELAVQMVIDRASYGDTLAEGVQITTGPAPDCPERL